MQAISRNVGRASKLAFRKSSGGNCRPREVSVDDFARAGVQFSALMALPKGTVATMWPNGCRTAVERYGDRALSIENRPGTHRQVHAWPASIPHRAAAAPTNRWGATKSLAISPAA